MSTKKWDVLVTFWRIVNWCWVFWKVQHLKSHEMSQNGANKGATHNGTATCHIAYSLCWDNLDTSGFMPFIYAIPAKILSTCWLEQLGEKGAKERQKVQTQEETMQKDSWNFTALSQVHYLRSGQSWAGCAHAKIQWPCCTFSLAAEVKLTHKVKCSWACILGV